jgi:hypothetical protein
MPSKLKLLDLSHASLGDKSFVGEDDTFEYLMSKTYPLQKLHLNLCKVGVKTFTDIMEGLKSKACRLSYISLNNSTIKAEDILSGFIPMLN